MHSLERSTDRILQKTDRSGSPKWRQNTTPSKRLIRTAKHDFVDSRVRVIGVRLLKVSKVRPSNEVYFGKRLFTAVKARANKKMCIKREDSDFTNIPEDRRVEEKRKLSWKNPMRKEQKDNSKIDIQYKMSITGYSDIGLSVAMPLLLEEFSSLNNRLPMSPVVMDNKSPSTNSRSSSIRNAVFRNNTSRAGSNMAISHRSADLQDQPVPLNFVKSLKRTLLGNMTSNLNQRSHPDSRLYLSYVDRFPWGCMAINPSFVIPLLTPAASISSCNRIDLYTIHPSIPLRDLHKRPKGKEPRDIAQIVQGSRAFNGEMEECKSVISRRITGQDNLHNTSIFQSSRDEGSRGSPNFSPGNFSHRRVNKSRGKDWSLIEMVTRKQNIPEASDGQEGTSNKKRLIVGEGREWSDDKHFWPEQINSSTNDKLSLNDLKVRQLLQAEVAVAGFDTGTSGGGTDRQQTGDQIQFLLDKFGKGRVEFVQTERKTYDKTNPRVVQDQKGFIKSPLNTKETLESDFREIDYADYSEKVIMKSPKDLNKFASCGVSPILAKTFPLGVASSALKDYSTPNYELFSGKFDNHNKQFKEHNYQADISNTQSKKVPVEISEKEMLSLATQPHQLSKDVKQAVDQDNIALGGVDTNKRFSFSNRRSNPNNVFNSPSFSMVEDQQNNNVLTGDDYVNDKIFHQYVNIEAGTSQQEPQLLVNMHSLETNAFGNKKEGFVVNGDPLLYKIESNNLSYDNDSTPTPDINSSQALFEGGGKTTKLTHHGHTKSLHSNNISPSNILSEACTPLSLSPQLNSYQRPPNNQIPKNQNSGIKADIQQSMTVPSSPRLTSSKLENISISPAAPFDHHNLTELLHKELAVDHTSGCDLEGKKKLIANQIVNIFDKIHRLDRIESKPGEDFKEVIRKSGHQGQ